MASLKWWQKAVFYQIYPRSFADGNGDGIGDFEGMIAKLDYLQWLGIDAVWLSPHFPSPQVDWGYDVSDYRGVAPEYGTLEQFHTFLQEIHRRNMHLVLDLVLNHTSDQHPWFLESRSSLNNPRRDWYVWRAGKNGDAPNDWASTFGGSAWTLDEATGEYYYHYFFKEQPDLNWENPAVKDAMFDVVRYWFDQGVDGFRLDAIGTIYETPGLPSHQTGLNLDDIYLGFRKAKDELEQAQVNHQWKSLFRHQHDLPELHDLMRALRSLTDEYADKVLIGETDDIRFYGDGQDELHLNFNFPLMRTKKITPQWVRANQEQRLGALPNGAWPCNTLGNHDAGRMISEFGDGIHDVEIARVNLALILTLQGTPFLYNGEEIGMVNHLGLRPEQFRDPLCPRSYQLETELMGSSPSEAAHFALLTGRDKSRTPLQWSNAQNAGFCPAGVEPWLPVHPNYAEGINVADQMDDPDSLLNFYRRILAARKALPALIEGSYRLLDQDNQHVFGFFRQVEDQVCLVLLNMSPDMQAVDLSMAGRPMLVRFSSHRAENEPLDGRVELETFEVLIGASTD